MNPSLRGKPIAVVPMMAETTCCIAASYEAKAFGIKTGTMVRDALRMCPNLILIEGNHEKYIHYHERIVEAVESCHPVTSVLSIDEMACRLQGRDQKPENAMALAQQIKKSILSVGSQLKSSVGLGPNRFLAKTASDMKKPDGLTLILKKDLPQIMYKLKLRDLCGIGENMERRLNQHGVFTMEQLYKLDLPKIRKVWGGIGGEYFYRWLRGEDFLLSHQEHQSIGHSHVLPPDLRNQDSAYSVIQKLLYKAGVRLRKYNLWAQSMSVSIRYLDGYKWANDVNMLECQDDMSLREILKHLWSQRMPGAPLKVSVVLFNLIHDSERTFSFLENQDQKRLQLTKAMDQINSRFGKYTLYFGGMKAAELAAPTRIAFSNIPSLDEA
ncbi:MAG: DNA polymerase IV [Oligoflexia bacterium]|nr:MAG: DNA polymerase IV [Oligoflexia bacterium]